MLVQGTTESGILQGPIWPALLSFCHGVRASFLWVLLPSTVVAT